VLGLEAHDERGVLLVLDARAKVVKHAARLAHPARGDHHRGRVARRQGLALIDVLDVTQAVELEGRVTAAPTATPTPPSSRIADATSIPHGDDTRPRAHQSGSGYGTVVIHYDDPPGEATGYGWYGLATRLDFRTHLARGRAVR